MTSSQLLKKRRLLRSHSFAVLTYASGTLRRLTRSGLASGRFLNSLGTAKVPPAIVLSAATVAFFSCSSDSKGITVDLGLVHHKAAVGGNIDTSEGEGVARTFDNDAAVAIVLSKAYLKVTSVALHECHSDRLVRILSNAVIPSAMAHGDDDPLSATSEQVIDILGKDLERVSMGEASPPAGDYCGAVIVVEPADDTTHSLPEDVDMVGKTFHLAGTQGGTPFTVESDQEGEVEIDFDETLTLDGSATGTKIAIGMVYDTWLDGVDFGASAAVQGAKVLENVLASFAHYTGDYTEAEDHAH